MFMMRLKVHIACICHKLPLVCEHAFTLSEFVGGMALVIIWPIEKPERYCGMIEEPEMDLYCGLESYTSLYVNNITLYYITGFCSQL